MDESRVKAFLNKLINDERRWTSDLETEARDIVADIERVSPLASVLPIGAAVQTAAGQSALDAQAAQAYVPPKAE